MTPRDVFGCESCWPGEPEAAWAARGRFGRIAELVDDSHFHVMILACPQCSQRFLSIFTEMIDWDAGDDAQYWMLMPVTDEEGGDLVKQGDQLTESALEAIGTERRCLQRAHPTGAGASLAWRTGVFIGMHD